MNCPSDGAAGMGEIAFGAAGTGGITVTPCLATDCQGQGKNCGMIEDGCGHTFNCGVCNSPLTCGSSGEFANVCSCLPNDFLCDGETLLRCSSNGSYYFLVAQCSTAVACNAIQGQCIPCSIESNACFGQQLRTCVDKAATGSGTSELTYGTLIGNPPLCPNGTICNPRSPTGSCDACTTGTIFCIGSQLQRCDDTTPTVSSPLETCATAALCEKSVFTGHCIRPACKISETRCAGSIAETCNDERTSFEKTLDCGTPNQCQNGSCL